MKEFILSKNNGDKKWFHADFKVKESSSRRIRGYASTRFPDRVNDVVLPQALKDAMGEYMKNPAILLGHDQEKPIGKTISWQITEDGLWIEAEIGTTPKANEAWAEIEQGLRTAFSIGFIPKEIDWRGDHPTITELELLEISVVTIPANRESLFSVVKGFLDGTDMIDKDLPKIGFEATMFHVKALRSALEQGAFKKLDLKTKILVEHQVRRMQNDIESDELEEERAVLESVIESQKACLQELGREVRN